MNNITLKTPCGEIKGLSYPEKGMAAFLGVRFASAPRFGLPEITKSWEGVYDATAFGNCCPQVRTYLDEFSLKNPFYSNEFRRGSTFTYGEDCLNLNIFAPSDGKDLPVIVFIHGGSFTRGSGDEKQNDGEAYVKRGVILVTINYRLGVFGLYSDGEKGFGNLMLYDQLAAIKWVYANIAAFGGDPSKITVMGQSAGAMCAQMLILTPQARELISGAILMSGAGLRGFPWGPRPVKKTFKYWRGVGVAATLGGAEALQEVSAKRLFEAWRSSNPVQNVLNTLPVVDGSLIRDNLSKAYCKDENKIPTIIGITKNDMVPFILYRYALRYARLQRERGTDCYLYFFDENLPGDDSGAFHSSDLWYAFCSLSKSERPFDDGDYELSRTMVDYFANFAKGKNPNGKDLPVWDKAAGKNQFISFNTSEIKMISPNKTKLILNTIKNKGAKR